MTGHTLLRGRVLEFAGSTVFEDLAQTVTVTENAGLLVLDGRIADLGPFDALRQKYPDAVIHDFGGGLIVPGFVDAHVHYPQTAIIASWGKRLIDWLNTYTFPEESRFHDPSYAQAIARRYLRLALAHGTTSFASFCTIHPASAEAIFEEAEALNMACVAGRTAMDQNAPETLKDTAQSAYDESRALIEKWHGRGRLRYAITPRFSPTSSDAQLQALGQLWGEYPSCLMQTHLSEQVDEIDWVRSLYPKARDYLDTYEQFGLIGENAIFGHAIHLEPREIDRLRESGASVAHCPTSNTFIGSGLFDLAGLAGRGVGIGLGTDTGGGSSFSMLRTMAATYEIAQLRGVALHPAQLLWLATQGSARAIGLGDQAGEIKKGAFADLVVLDLASTEAIAQRAERAQDIWEEIFPTLMMGDDRAISQVFVAGQAML